MVHYTKAFAIIFLLLTAFALPAANQALNECADSNCQGNQYFAGFVKVDITPELGQRIPTMMADAQVLEEVQDPLFAKALVITDGQTQIGFISLDLLFLDNDQIQALRQFLLQSSNLDRIYVTVTHTHSGVFDKRNLEQLKTRTSAALLTAKSELTAVEIGASSIDVDEAYNRRILRDSNVEMLWVNPQRKANREVDTALGVVHIRTLTGTPFVSLLNYSAHPTVTMDLNNVVVSADYPGAMARNITSKLGGEVLFLLGAAGDVNPYDSDTKPLELALEKSELMGKNLAYAAITAIENIKSYTAQGNFLYAKQSFTQPDAEISTLILAPDIAIATFPGEYFNDFGEQLKAKSPIANTIFVGYTNGSIGYVPTELDAKLGGYGADLEAPELIVTAVTGQEHVDAAVLLVEQLAQKINSHQ